MGRFLNYAVYVKLLLAFGIAGAPLGAAGALPVSLRRCWPGLGGWRPALGLLLLIALALLALGCRGEDAAAPTLTAAATPLIALPADEGPHPAPIEWWYFNGLLEDDGGHDYGFHFVTFKTLGLPSATPHLMQASLGDHQAGRHYTAERAALLPVAAGAASVDAAIDQWVMRGEGASYDLRFDLAGIGLDLRAVTQRGPALHGGSGLLELGPAGHTYYYSRPRLEVQGYMERNGEVRPIVGDVWMDHQWGQLSSQLVGWDWASIQLEDGSDFTLAFVQNPINGEPYGSYATYIAPDGAAQTLAAGDYALEHTGGYWRSPATAVTYPLGWRAESGSLELSLELTPILEQAEFGNSGIVAAAYWEGAVRVSGSKAGAPVSGWGFVELVGYDPRQLQLEPPLPATPAN